jgi:hypothetical protein
VGFLLPTLPGEEEEVGGGERVVLPGQQLFRLRLPRQSVVISHHPHHLLIQHPSPVPVAHTHQYGTYTTSVADPDPGSGAFLNPGSEIQDPK